MDNGIISSFSVLVFVFICHYGKETKKSIGSLLHQRFTKEQFGSFLDFKSLNLGENIPKKIREVILKCTTAIILFSPGFCSSKYCLNEVLMILEEKKPFIPIFWDIDPSELEAALEDNKGHFPESDMENYRAAIKEVIDIGGIVFQSNKQ
ncbi:hypothetical protein MLD38_016762 [Melastoma candidum]|uniref:Uncharacterized protein n=1 Tax=Melastoma candidum TaxID=119954 RepID=A0ACB9QNG7_9MYRT|nr:hypothetical protein MLD38_016762 [Melastoma candidum]